jgi:hypothetical protein
MPIEFHEGQPMHPHTSIRTRQPIASTKNEEPPRLTRYISLLRSLLLASTVLLSACSARNQIQPEPDAETGKPLDVILLVPSPAPKRLFTDNRSIPVIGMLANGISNTIWDKYKSADFNNQYADFRNAAGEKMTAAIHKELLQRGFAVKLASPEQIIRDEHGQLNFARFPAGTTILDVRLDNFGMYSGRTSSDYVPYIDAYILLATSKYEEEGHLHYAYYMYGGTANRDGWGYLLPDPQYAFPDFRSLMEKSDLVRESYDQGIARIARQLVKDIRFEFKPLQTAHHNSLIKTPVETPARVGKKTLVKPKTKSIKRKSEPQ